MSGRFEHFDPSPGGSYRLILIYSNITEARGKATETTDIVEGRFVKIVPNVRIVQAVNFVSDDPAFSGTMTMTWEIAPIDDKTHVEVRAEHVPHGISAEDHAVGLASSLANLAHYTDPRLASTKTPELECRNRSRETHRERGPSFRADPRHGHLLSRVGTHEPAEDDHLSRRDTVSEEFADYGAVGIRRVVKLRSASRGHSRVDDTPVERIPSAHDEVVAFESFDEPRHAGRGQPQARCELRHPQPPLRRQGDRAQELEAVKAQAMVGFERAVKFARNHRVYEPELLPDLKPGHGWITFSLTDHARPSLLDDGATPRANRGRPQLVFSCYAVPGHPRMSTSAAGAGTEFFDRVLPPATLFRPTAQRTGAFIQLEVLTWSKRSRGVAPAMGCPLGLEQRSARSSDGGSD
jgi:hypothetical protein